MSATGHEACPRCEGLGFGLEADDGRFIADSLSSDRCKRCLGSGTTSGSDYLDRVTRDRELTADDERVIADLLGRD